MRPAVALRRPTHSDTDRTQNAPVSGRADSVHTSTPDTTEQSCLRRVWRGGVNWTIAVNVFRLQVFCRRQSPVVGSPPIHTDEADATETGQFCRVWRGGVN